MNKKLFSLAAVLFAGSLSLAACGDAGNADNASDTDNAAHDADGTDTATTADEAGGAASVVQLTEGYCRAKPDARNPEDNEHMTELDAKHSDMTSCFGTLKNTSDKDVTVVSFASPALEGSSTELHEVVDGMMREKAGGFTIAPGGTYELVPGGDHLMIMNCPGAIPAGEKIAVEITMSDGSVQALELPVREQPSGEENYGGDAGAEHADHTDHAGHAEHAGN
ncbi:copper chaperone PCu(A)C [Corynebacterium urinipleomorphum]|uniref:copper chaperone PCu(A)C n=1 Tax=Corynebacterium urinipleomorphum TaxID=1852380 RepID=UPI000B35E658|nr:copper chaperone PCu(A)C [Corynebacterium urinipleomorphum]